MAGAASKAKTVIPLLLLFNLCVVLPAPAWERGAADKIVAAARSTLPADLQSFLEQRSSFFQEGLMAEQGVVERYLGFSRYDTTGYAAQKLADQIDLLRDLFPEARSDYMAFRLGVLASTVMNLSSPFAASNAPEAVQLRARFMDDVEAHLAELKYTPRPPRVIRSPVSFARIRIERSAGWAGPVRSQYLSGKGYNFIVQQAASKFYGEAIDSVGDVLYTIGTDGRGKVAGPVRYDFYRDACHFYDSRGRVSDALGAYREMGKAAASEMAAPLGTLEEAVDRYALILQVMSLEESMRKAGIEGIEPLGRKLMEDYLSDVSALAKSYIEAGSEDKARVALDLCLREGYLTEWSLAQLRKLYGLDKLENLEVPENAWKIYLEANGFESMGGKALAEGRLWAANEAYVRAAALYSAIPESARNLRRTSRARIDQIIGRMQAIPPAALLSEEFFQSAVDSMKEGDVNSAVRNFQVSRRWGPGEKALDSAAADAESLKLFTQGRDLFQDGKYDKGVGYFRKLTTRFPASPFAGPAKKMIELYEKKKALDVGRLAGLLKGAYEASFVGDVDTCFDLCDEILVSGPSEDLKDRAQLLIAVAWYEANQKGYLKIDRIFSDLLRNRVLKESGGKLVLRKNIDFYFGLRDTFPEIDLDQFDDSLLAKIDLKGAEGEAVGAREGADEAIARAGDKIESVDDLIARGEDEERAMGDSRSLLDEASARLDGARDRFDEGAYEEAKELADEAYDKAEEAEDQAAETLEVSESLMDEARDKIDTAEAAVAEAQAALDETEDQRDITFSELRSDLEDAEGLLDEAKDLFDGGDYAGAIEKAEKAIEDAADLKDRAEELREAGDE